MSTDSSINKFKAGLGTKGFTQIESIDYEETFYPMVRFSSILLLLTLVAHLDLKLFQMDIKIIFLDGSLENDICMDQPIGFVVKGQGNKVYYRKRPIYGLK